MDEDQPTTSKVPQVQKFRFLMTGILFAILLLLPALDQWQGFSENFKSTEKHALTPMPSFEFPHVQTFIVEFNQYFKENFGWRNALFYQYSQLKYVLMGVSPLPHKVILGKNNWFYPGNDVNKIAEQHQGLHPLEPATLKTIAQRLTEKQQEFARQGIRFYVTVAPDSYSIYPENLPDYLQAYTGRSNLDILDEYLKKNSPVPFIDLRPALRAAKSSRIIYLKTDTHWNDYGALLATLTIMKRVRQDFPQIPVPDESRYRIEEKAGYGGDLVTMMALNQTIIDTVNFQITPPADLRAQEIENRPPGKDQAPFSRYVSPNKKAPGLVFVGDSFSITLSQDVPGYFSKAFIVRSGVIKPEWIQAEKPDVVILEIVERNLAELATI